VSTDVDTIGNGAESANAVARLDRVLRYALPLLLLIFASDLLDGVVRGPQWMWNESRLASAFSLAYGYSLYPGEHALGPVIGTLHAPVGYLVYAGLAFLKDPLAALLAGCAVTVLLYFAPLFWLHMHAGQGTLLTRVYGFLACAAVVVASPGTNYSALNIHVDVTAIAAAVLAAGILATARAPLATGMLACSAVLGVLSVAAKQTMAPVPVALACFMLAAEGPRRFLRFVLLQLVSGVLIGAAVLVAFRPTEDLLFNTYTWAVHLHRPADTSRLLLAGLYAERVTLAAVVPVLVVLLAGVLFAGAGSVRARLNANRWLVFLFAAMLQVPVALRAWTTPGADVNHLGVVTLFVTLAATTGLIMEQPIPVLVQRALLLGIIIASLSFPWQLARGLAELPNTPAEVAFRYERQHRGRVYFPLNPLAVLLAEGKLTHYDVALFDRERGGYPVSPALLASGMPPHYQLIAWPPNDDPPPSVALARVLQSMQPVREPGLEGWHVFGPAGGAAR
jgi:hypothetical protein